MKMEYFHEPLAKIETILEIKQMSDIDGFSIRKEKVSLPKINNSNKGMAIYFLNTSREDIAEIMNNDHPLILNQGSAYKRYFYDYRLLRKSIKSSRIKNPGKTPIELKKERLNNYGEMQSLSSIIVTPKSPEVLANKNVIYDLEPFTDLIKLQTKLRNLPLILKLKVYFDSIGSLYDTINLPNYQKGHIFVNLDGYNKNCDLNDYVFYDYMMLLLKKSDNIINKIMQSVPEMNIFFYTKKGYILINTKNDFKRENYSKLVNFTKRLKPEIGGVDKKYDSIIKRDFESKINMRMNFVGDFDDDIDDEELLDDTITKKVEKVNDNEPEEKTDEDNSIFNSNEEYPEEPKEKEEIDNTIDEIENDEELKSAYIKSITKKNAGVKSVASLKRDELLRERQMKIKMKGKTIGELIKDMPNPPEIPVTKIDNAFTDNEELTNVKFYNFESAYINECFDRDIAKAITSFNDKGINVNVTNVKIEDTSTELVFQDTYTIEFEDENRRRHTIKVNIPKLVEDKFIIVNGKKRVIEKQLVGLPIIKTGPNEVQIVTNYNKLWLTRRGSRFNPNTEKFKKILFDKSKSPEGTKITVYKGYNLTANEKYATCLEYDEFAAKYNKIIINDCVFVFSIEILKEELGNKYKDPTLDNIIIGYRGKQKTPIVYNTKSDDHQDMVSLMVKEALPDYYDEFKKLSSGRKYIHNTMKIMEKEIPIIFIICFFEGITTVVKKFNELNGSNQVEFVDTKSNDNYIYIRFSDGYLKYPMNNIEACVLFNGFTDLELKDFSIADMDDRDTYLEIFDRLLGSAYYAGGFINYYDFMIDFKTLEILKMLHYPEDIVSLIIYASNLLADSSYSDDIDPTLYRLRNVEIIPAILYKEMATAYGRYRKTANNAKPGKITIDPDCIMKNLNSLPTVSSYSSLSPIVEVKSFGIASMKGFKGMNKDRSYNEKKRNYHDNMLGIIGATTDVYGNCGKERHLVVEPNVSNAYGMFKIDGRENAKNMNATQLMTTEEMTYPFGLQHDDPNRTAMTSKQSGHALPVAEQSPCLISNGFDSTIHYRTTNDFSYVAKQDGTVIDMNNDTNIMIIKYKDGTTQAIDLEEKTVQNGGGGFYLRAKLDTTFKKGDKFKKSAILAFNKNYYKDTGVMGNKLTYGTLVKNACISNMATFEDSTWSTYRMAKAMAAEITMKEVETVIGKNSNIDFIVKKGDRVYAGDDLIRFDTAYSDAEMNELMNNIRSDLQEDIVNLGKTKFVSHHDGIVTDVRVFPVVERSEMSASLRKVVDNIQSHEKARRKFMDKYDENKNSVYRKGIYFTETCGTVKPDLYGKIRGVDASDGVLIEIYVTYRDELSDGDKLAHMSANKGTICYMVPRGYEPYTLSRPYEEIDIPLAPSAILARGTPSVITQSIGYKVLIELKRKLYEVLTGQDWNEKARKERPYMDCHNFKDIKVTTESTNPDIGGYGISAITMANDRMNIMESVFDFDKSSDGKYKANKEYSKGDIVLSGLNFKETLYRVAFESRLSSVDEGYEPNIVYDETSNAYIAKDVIYYGERFIVSKEV